MGKLYESIIYWKHIHNKTNHQTTCEHYTEYTV